VATKSWWCLDSRNNHLDCKYNGLRDDDIGCSCICHIKPTPDHMKYLMGASEQRLLQIIYDLVRQGYNWSRIKDILSHAQFFAAKENLDLFDVIKGTRQKGCITNQYEYSFHSHKQDNGIALVYNMLGGDSIEVS